MRAPLGSSRTFPPSPWRSQLGYLLPAAVWLCLFSLLPLGMIAVISLTERGSPITWELTFASYVRLLDPLLLTVVLRSLWMACVTTALCLTIGYPLAYFIVRQRPRLRHWCYFLTLVPLWANSLVLTYAWMVLLRADGVIDQGARLIGWSGPHEHLNWLYTPGAVVAGLVYWYLPFMVYPIYSSLEKFDWRLVEAAQDLGATRVAAFFRVLLPLTWPGVLAGGLLVFIPALGNFVVPQLLGGAKAALIGNVIQERFLSHPQDWPLGSALALVIMLLISIAIWAYFKFAHEGRAIG
ncbi:MAG TPA: ABC transporter permease [Candidatus Tectomicrobia bacterium]|nr:ABC transporter permease [Candidatus Tectomicrobia bacterium]